MRRRLEKIFEASNKNAYQDVYALPKIDDIRLNAGRVCLVLSPDYKVPPAEAEAFWRSVTEKNNFCVVTGDGSSLGNLDEKTRRIWAVAKVLETTGGDKSPYLSELQDEGKQAEHVFNTTVCVLFNRVYYPAKNGLTPAKLSMTFGESHFKGEEQIEKALADVGASKFFRVLDDVAIETLLGRAEDMLWPAGGDRRIPWRDVASRALSNERWPWLPLKGLETLRKAAEARGRWKYSEDGYVEKGPFPKAKTQVMIAERDYKDETGKATIEVQPRDAGRHGRIHYGYDANVSAKSPTLTDAVLETDDTVRWFLAVDPDGVHETGEPKKWQNRLTLTHEVTTLPGGKRRVALSVKPRGTIRWNTAATNRKEGAVYSGAFDLPGDGEVTVYAYAEDQGVAAERDFKIPRVDQKGPTVVKSEPARLRKKMDFRGSSQTFAMLVTLENLQATLTGNVSLTIGEGAKAITMRFGTDLTVDGPTIRKFIANSREAVGDETADVVLRVEDVKFLSGHDLEKFVEEQKVELGTGEIEQ